MLSRIPIWRELSTVPEQNVELVLGNDGGRRFGWGGLFRAPRLIVIRFHALIAAAALVTACAVTPPVTPSVPPTPVAAAPTPSVRVWLDQPSYFVDLQQEMVVDGDRALLLGLDFNVPMDPAEVEAHLRATLPPATGYRWETPASLRAEIPAGDSFDFSLTGVHSLAGASLVMAKWHIARPLTEIAVYPITDANAWPTSTRSWELRLVVQNGMLILAPGTESALLYHGLTPRKSEFSLVNVSTGQHLSQPFGDVPGDIPSNGWSVMDWTADGRLLVVGGNRTLIGDALGARATALRSFEGQAGLLSPSRRFLFLWSCTAGEAWMMDLEAGRDWRLGEQELPCAPGASVAWTPSDQLAIGDVTDPLRPSFRVRVFDATGGLRRTLAGFRPLVGLADGAFVVGHRFTQAFHDDGGPFSLMQPGRTEHVLPSGVLFVPSPNGRFLAYTSLDGDTPIANLWDLDGDQPLTMRGARIGGWTKDGALAIVRILRP
jgi:hypothetical protein